MKKRWWIVGSVAVVLGVGAASMALLGSPQGAGMPVSVGKVTTAALETKVLTSGIVTVADKQRVYANVSGILREFAVKEGDVVKKGQVIGKIDTSDVESRIMEIDAQIELARANLSKAQAGSEPEELEQERERVAQAERDYDNAKREYERIRQLHESGATTQQELDKAKAQLDSALSQLNVTRQQYALKQKGPRKEEIASLQAQINSRLAEKALLEKERVQSVLVAPTDGTVIDRAAENSQYVNKGTEILTIANLNHLLIEADINESDVSKIKLGQTAVIEGSALGKQRLNAKVIRISPIAVTTPNSSGQGEKTRVKVTLEPSGDLSALKPGFHVDIDISVQKIDNARQVPIEAVQQEADGSTFVWVAENGAAKKRKVTVGVENELFAEITSGLKGDEQVILGPFDTLQENAPVLPSEEPQNSGI
ncbi:HlyD family secretion protein [Brevibacillus aydinogluensis]|jgi:HlyD family secretion protein|uniref:efflux RND transporter periplasmic adaptor subunit n=1 Tax=Brevibacillus aydinogluensis TaxID=927786 RepID=UPI000E395850|nr:efflux RND transporter periplasmic adaptor subunit [Brevibacillus aydinogluensis]MDT3417505.1 HlyD family secretion protein [Brevibacillus aydinogluensis]REK66804.1 MAG: efflux RND transporter periplasmic adaptor subunit [Brevibacillus sp.]